MLTEEEKDARSSFLNQAAEITCTSVNDHAKEVEARCERLEVNLKALKRFGVLSPQAKSVRSKKLVTKEDEVTNDESGARLMKTQSFRVQSKRAFTVMQVRICVQISKQISSYE